MNVRETILFLKWKNNMLKISNLVQFTKYISINGISQFLHKTLYKLLFIIVQQC